MRKLLILFAMGFLCGMATACTGSTPASTPAKNTEDAGSPLPTTGSPIPSPAAPILSVTPPPGRSPSPTLAPDAWQSMPVIPAVSDTTRRIYQTGLLLHNDSHAFSILGDCLSLPNSFFQYFGKGPEHYNLGDYTILQPVIDWFHDSFNRQSITLGNGFTSAAVLSPLMNDPKQCQGGETPMACEYRVHHPSYALIALGTDDYKSTPAAYESRMRQIVEYTISKGIIPILRTKADNREGNDAFNKILARLAYEYDIPLWNFWAAVKPLPYGLLDDQGHLYWADPNHFDYANSLEVAVPVYNLTALQTLDAVWRGVTAA